LAERAAENAAEVERAYGAIIEDEDDGARSGKAQELEDEYEDEEQLATVTVVEDFDPDALLHPSDRTISTPRPVHEPHHTKPKLKDKDAAAQKRMQTKVVAKAKDIKYHTNAGRKAERSKQLRRKTEKAERAGGKASRHKPHGRARR